MYDKNFYSAYGFDLSESKIQLYVPKNFSLLSDSNVVFDFYKKIIDLRFSNRKEIIINFSKCKELDIGALSILSTLLLHLRHEAITKEKNTKFKTTFTGKKELDILIYKVGIITLLKIELFPEKVMKYIDNLKIEIANKNIKTLPFLVGGKTQIEFLPDLALIKKTAKYISDHTKFGNEVVNFINQCLESTEVTLSVKGKSRFKGMLGELATNSFEHLGEAMSQLYCTGYYTIDESDVGNGSIVFYNFGNTIYESLKYDSTEDIKIKLNELSKQHYFDEEFSEENLWTVAALQPKISRKFDEKIDNERGTGTIRLIEGFKQFSGSENKKMTIISGKTQIIFDNSELTSYNEKSERIAFNTVNSLEERPLSEYVKNLKHSFPGTIIMIQYCLNKQYLKTITTK